MLPMLQREVVQKKEWATEEELVDFFSLSQCVPGIIAVNMATFIGQKIKGVPGGIFATLGVVFPSLVIIILIAALLSNFSDLPAVQNAFAGIRACVCVLVANAVVKLWKSAKINVFTILVFAAVFACTALTDISPVFLVPASAVAGIIARNLEARAK